MAFKVTKVFSEAHSSGGNDFQGGMFQHLRTLAFLFLLPLLFAQAAYAGIDSKLLKAAKAGNTDKVEQLLEQGADVNAKSQFGGRTALMLAAWDGHTKTVKTLIDAEADVNAKDENGWTALMAPAGMGRTEIVEILKQAGAKE